MRLHQALTVLILKKLNVILLTDKTIIYVTHKIHKKMLQGFDDILVLSHGKLVEHGSFEDLLCKKNYFYHLFMNQ